MSDNPSRKPYKATAIVYLHDHEIDAFEDALENAICPCPEDENGNHECRLGMWGISPCEDEDE